MPRLSDETSIDGYAVSRMGMSDYDEMDRPVFDFVEQAYLAGDKGDMLLVVHRGIDGEVVAAHTPMKLDDIKCAICASGVRVYMEVKR